jgi:hypothetical protein
MQQLPPPSPDLSLQLSGHEVREETSGRSDAAPFRLCAPNRPPLIAKLFLRRQAKSRGLSIQTDQAANGYAAESEPKWSTAPGDPNAEEPPVEQGCSSSAL